MLLLYSKSQIGRLLCVSVQLVTKENGIHIGERGEHMSVYFWNVSRKGSIGNQCLELAIRRCQRCAGCEIFSCRNVLIHKGRGGVSTVGGVVVTSKSGDISHCPWVSARSHRRTRADPNVLIRARSPSITPRLMWSRV